VAAGTSLRPGEGRATCQFFQERLRHTFGVEQNIIVPEAQHTPSMLFKPFRSVGIICVVEMLAAIQLDHQFMSDTDEIGDKGPDRPLPPEFVICELPAPQRVPKPALGIGRVPA
jgi:hypothetical protein